MDGFLIGSNVGLRRGWWSNSSIEALLLWSFSRHNFKDKDVPILGRFSSQTLELAVPEGETASEWAFTLKYEPSSRFKGFFKILSFTILAWNGFPSFAETTTSTLAMPFWISKPPQHFSFAIFQIQEIWRKYMIWNMISWLFQTWSSRIRQFWVFVLFLPVNL